MGYDKFDSQYDFSLQYNGGSKKKGNPKKKDKDRLKYNSKFVRSKMEKIKTVTKKV